MFCFSSVLYIMIRLSAICRYARTVLLDINSVVVKTRPSETKAKTKTTHPETKTKTKTRSPRPRPAISETKTKTSVYLIDTNL